MKKLLLLVLPFTLASAGCATMALEHYTVNQSQSAADYRYHAVLHCLAMVAGDPNTLPSYALLSNGTTSVTVTGILNPTVNWGGAPEVFASAVLGFTGSRSPAVAWTVSPVADHTQLEAMRCACRWVLEGPEHIGHDCVSILADPEDPVASTWRGPHFGVLERLGHLPHGWLHCGRLRDVPTAACFKDHCGDTWVWVMPDGMEGLAGFTLVLQDIATLLVAPTDGSIPQNKTPPLFVTLWLVDSTLPAKPDVVVINIKRNGNEVVYPEKTEVTVGQYVIWRNVDSDGTTSHSATSRVLGLFDTDLIPNGASSKAILFDDAMYTGAGGYTKDKINDPSASVTIEYFDKTQPKIKSQIILKRNSFTSAYSPTLVFREDRVVKPECKSIIEERIRTQVKANPTQPVAIEWAEWLAMTTPYQGQRTAVKPGSTQATPIIQPTRLVPAATVINAFQTTVPRWVPPLPPAPPP